MAFEFGIEKHGPKVTTPLFFFLFLDLLLGAALGFEQAACVAALSLLRAR